MDKFLKSLLIGVGASIFIIGGLAGIGIWVSSEPDVFAALPVKQDNKTYTVRMNAHQVQLGGYSLKSAAKEKPEIILVSVELTVKGAQNQHQVCRLMPRLVSSLNTAFAGLVSHGPGAGLDRNMGNSLRQRFNRALGGNVVTAVSLRTYADGDKVPGSTCPDEA